MLRNIKRDGKTGVDLLSPRQREVYELVVLGLKDREVAAKLCISTQTVKNHLQAVRTVMDLPSRRQISTVERLRDRVECLEDAARAVIRSQDDSESLPFAVRQLACALETR